MIETLFTAVTVLFVTMDPIGNMPLFMSLTNSPREDYKKSMAKRSVLIGGTVLILFAFVGERFLHLLGITLPSFKIAGGIMLFVVALQMVFMNEEKKDDDDMQQAHGDVSVFPLAVPLIAGPGSITSVMLMMSSAQETHHQMFVVVAIIIVLGITYAAFRLSGFFARVMGESINQVITKILGLVLGAMAAQFIVDGFKAVLSVS